MHSQTASRLVGEYLVDITFQNLCLTEEFPFQIYFYYSFLLDH